jgi:hypothetical protein
MRMQTSQSLNGADLYRSEIAPHGGTHLLQMKLELIIIGSTCGNAGLLCQTNSRGAASGGQRQEA